MLPQSYRPKTFVFLISLSGLFALTENAAATAMQSQFGLAAKWKGAPSKQDNLSNKGFFYREGNTYYERTAELPNTGECSQVLVANDRKVDISYLHCSDEALARDGEPEEITKDFSIPEGLARRVHFWRRVYTMYSINDYVLHSSEFPEVVLEIGRYAEPAREVTAAANVKRVLRDRERHYRDLLLAMHFNRNVGSFSFDPVMQRLARQMAHIKDPNKFRIVANSLRVQRGQREYIARGIEHASRYLPLIESEFLKQGAPVELAKIAFVESSFNINAVSKVGASGVYQFMNFTAKPYLRIDDNIDERRDPIKSGAAAAKLFLTNHRILKSWPLAVTAYNHGPYGILRAAKKAGSSDLVHLVYNHSGGMFGFASKNFYTSFLAILSTMESREKYFPGVQISKPIDYQEYRLPSALSIAHLRKKFNLSIDEIAQLNPDIERRHIVRGGLLPRGFVLKVPSDKTGDRNAALDLSGYEFAEEITTEPMGESHYRFINMAHDRIMWLQEGR